MKELFYKVASKSNELTIQFGQNFLLEGRGVDVDEATFVARLHAAKENVSSLKA